MTKVNACIEAGYMFLLITPAMLVPTDRKSTRLNSSHGYMSYAGFCLEKNGLIPYFMLEQGLEEQEAVAQAMRVGLRSAELMEQALEYVRSRQGLWVLCQYIRLSVVSP